MARATVIANGATIRNLRAREGWSQEDLAQAIDKSTKTINRIENGYPTTIKVLERIASLFKVPVETLLRYKPSEDDVAIVVFTVTAKIYRNKEHAEEVVTNEVARFVERLKSLGAVIRSIILTIKVSGKDAFKLLREFDKGTFAHLGVENVAVVRLRQRKRRPHREPAPVLIPPYADQPYQPPIDFDNPENIAALKNSNSPLWAAFVDTFRRFVGNLVFHRYRYESLSNEWEDVFQSVMARLVAALQKGTVVKAQPFSMKEYLAGLVQSVVKYEFRSYREAAKRFALTAGVDTLRDARSTSDLLEKAASAELADILLDLAKSILRPTNYDILLLRLSTNLNYREIAEQLSITPAAAMVRYSRALRQLRKAAIENGLIDVDHQHRRRT